MAGGLGVTLKHPVSGPVTSSVVLPYPAHDQNVEIVTNQREYNSPSGKLFTVTVNAEFYRITRTFEMLSESQASALFAFLETANFFMSRIRFCYVDSVSGATREVACRLCRPPSEVKRMTNFRDVTLVFEQYTHPDAVTES
jgi:hypothetical protein